MTRRPSFTFRHDSHAAARESLAAHTSLLAPHLRWSDDALIGLAASVEKSDRLETEVARLTRVLADTLAELHRTRAELGLLRLTKDVLLTAARQAGTATGTDR